MVVHPRTQVAAAIAKTWLTSNNENSSTLTSLNIPKTKHLCTASYFIIIIIIFLQNAILKEGLQLTCAIMFTLVAFLHIE